MLFNKISDLTTNSIECNADRMLTETSVEDSGKQTEFAPDRISFILLTVQHRTRWNTLNLQTIICYFINNYSHSTNLFTFYDFFKLSFYSRHCHVRHSLYPENTANMHEVCLCDIFSSSLIDNDILALKRWLPNNSNFEDPFWFSIVSMLLWNCCC